jgi:hypothetical protein
LCGYEEMCKEWTLFSEMDIQILSWTLLLFNIDVYNNCIYLSLLCECTCFTFLLKINHVWGQTFS